MRSLQRLCIIAVLSLCMQSVFAKSIVVLLDNSASMNPQTGERFSQCEASLFSMQLILSTQNKADDVYIIPAYRTNEEVQILKNPTLEAVRERTCYNASIYKSLKESLALVKSVPDDVKTLILIGDGEWFIEGDDLDANGKRKLVEELIEIAKDTKMWYLNTSSQENKNNQFISLIKEAKKTNPNIAILETDNEPKKLLDSFGNVAKSLLNIPNAKQQVKLNKNQVIFETDIPNEEIFVLIQSFGKPYSGKIASVKFTVNNNLKVYKNLSISKGNLFGGLYAIRKDTGLIEQGEIKLIFDSPIPEDATISVFHNPGIEINKPTFAGNSDDILSAKGNEYRVCQGLKDFPIEYSLRDKFNKALSVKSEDIVVQIRDVEGNVVNRLTSKNSLYKTTLKLNENLKNESFLFYIKIGDSFEDKIPIIITKSPCVELFVESKEFHFKHYLAAKKAFVREIELPVIYDKKTQQEVPDEQRYIDYKVKSESFYTVKVGDKIKIRAKKKEDNFCEECLRIAGEKEIQIELTHPNLKETVVYTIHIKQTDAPWWERCLLCIIIITTLLLLFVYWMLLRRKKKFYRKNKKRAKVIKYVDDDIKGNKFLKTNLLNKLNPFVPERCKLYGFSFVATRNQIIQVKTSSLKARSNRGFKIYECSADGFRMELTKDELENKKYISLTPDNGFEFADGYERERIIYEISRKK